MLRDFLLLMKASICLLVIVTGAAGIAWEGSLLADPLRFALCLFALFLCAGSANAFNQVYERDLDALMERTRLRRPLPQGRLSPLVATVFATAIGLAGTAIFALMFNALSALLALGTIVFYAVFYTMYLKPRTAQNIVIGGAAGAMGPVIGWAAAADSLAVAPILMFLIIFLWTPPHFWALALYRRNDYVTSGLPMMPNVIGEEATLRQMVAYTVILVVCSLGLVFSGGGLIYALLAVVSGAHFFWHCLKTWKARSDASYRGLFGYSILYLFVLFVGMMVDVAIRVPLPGLPT